MGQGVIVCGKLDNCISFATGKSELSEARRIVSDNPNKASEVAYIPISTNGTQILYQGGIVDADDFLNEVSRVEGRRVIVLTRKEHILILDKVALRNVRISVLEVDYPIFPEVRHSPSLRVNLDILNRFLRKIRSLGLIGGSFARDQSLRNLHAVARKLRFKNGLDRNFFFAYKDGYQEVFKLKEERADRVVIALDFNSMFADCMRGEFCVPRSVRYRTFVSGDVAPDGLDEGIYRVVLRGAKDGFFLDKHPFLYKRLGKSYRFVLAPGDSVEAVLFNNEIEYYAGFFHEIEVKEGFCSGKTMQHPLIGKAGALYESRRYYRSRGDAVMENYCKTSLQMMHSSTNRRIYKKKRFDSLHCVLNFLSSEFQLNFDEGSTLTDIHRFFRHNKYFNLHKSGRYLELTYLHIDADSLLFSLSAKIVANARIKVMKAIERFLDHDSVEICYSNIDSIHVSVKKSEAESFIDRHKDLISDEIGCFKIQAFADQGYWFDVGRYWLKKDGEVVLFKNKKFNFKGAGSEFVSKRKVFVLSKSDAFSQLGYRIAQLENSFSYSKRVKTGVTEETVEFERYTYPEVECPEAADVTEANEMMKSKKLKVELFRRISR